MRLMAKQVHQLPAWEEPIQFPDDIAANSFSLMENTELWFSHATKWLYKWICLHFM